MLWTITVMLMMLWLSGLVTGYATGYLIHVPLFFAIIAMLIKIEADCSYYGAGYRRKRDLKRQLVNGSGKILQKLAILPAEQVIQPIISRPTYKKE